MKFLFGQQSRVASMHLEMNPQVAAPLFKALEPAFARARGNMEMVITKPKPQDLALGLRAFAEDAKRERRFPRGTFDPPPDPTRYRAMPPDHRISWMASLLPYLGHEEDYNQIIFNKSWKDPLNQKVASVLIPQFLDSRSPQERWRIQPRDRMTLRGLSSLEMLNEPASTHYVGIAGVGLDSPSYTGSDAEQARKMGVFGYDRQAGLADIIDGVSNTILMIRVPWDKTEFPLTTHQRAWMAGGGSTVQGVPETHSIQPFVSMRMEKNLRGTYAIMVDGSVRFISEKVDDKVFQSLCTINGKEKVNLDKDAVLVSTAPNRAEMEAKLNPPPPPSLPQETEKAPQTPAGWQAFSPGGGGFSVLMPGNPKELSQSIKTPIGDVTMKMFNYEVPGNQGIYAVQYADYPSNLIQNPALLDKILDGARQGMVSAIPGAKVLNEQKVTQDGYSGREVKIEIAGQGTMKVKYFMAGSRMYIIMVGGPQGLPESKNAEMFFGSFKITKTS